jgi:hypothetical protein
MSAIVGNIDAEGGDYMPGPPRIVGDSQLSLGNMLPGARKEADRG